MTGLKVKDIEADEKMSKLIEPLATIWGSW